MLVISKIIVAMPLIIFLLFGIDSTFIGFLSKLLGNKRLMRNVVIKGKIIEEKIHIGVATNIAPHASRLFIKIGLGMYRFTLTKNIFIFQDTILTYYYLVNVEDIDSISIKKGLFGNSITLFTTVNGNKDYIYFRTNKLDVWIKAFSSLGIKQGNSKSN